MNCHTELTRGGAGGAARILILDDEPCVSELLSELLRLLGYEPTKCSSPAEALELIGGTRFDVILSDFRMPQMNGDVFFAKATAKHPELAGRVIFLTGDSMHDETQAFLQKHSAPHLSKPFDLATVEQLISRTIAQSHRAVAA